MPIEPTTIFFEDYFDSADPLDNYDPQFYDPPQTRGLSDYSFSIRRGEGPSGEDCLRYLPSTSSCPGCTSDCGTPSADCYMGAQFLRRRVEGPTTWYHVRAWVKATGSIPQLDGYDPSWANWSFDETWPGYAIQLTPLAIVMPNPAQWPYDSDDEGQWVSISIGGYTYNLEPTLLFRYPNAIELVNLYGFPGATVNGAVPVGDWACYEIAVGNIDAVAGTGTSRLWFNGKLARDVDWDFSGQGTPGIFPRGPGDPTGFFFGSGPDIYTAPPWTVPPGPSRYDGPHGWNPFQERYPDRRWGLSAQFARIAAADGPIGCLTRGGVPPDEAPDPDALRCHANDDYANAHLLQGECGRAICLTKARTRESWETSGAGFPSEKSFWYAWVAPRSDRFIFRTRGSEVFNELSIHRHTGATPPPLVAMAEDDPWDPDASTSSAVEVAVEEGVEYRIRVASALDGWTVLDFGPAKPIVNDDGWSINEGERATRTRVEAFELVAGLAVQDDQVAAASNGAGALATMDPILFGELSV